MKFLLLLLSVTIATFGYAQKRKGQLHLSSSDNKHVLYVSFGLNVTLDSQNYTEELKNTSPEFKTLADEYGFQLKNGISISEEKLLEMEANAIKYSGSADAVKKLRNIYSIGIENATNSKLLEIGTKLEQLDLVEYCALSSLKPIQPPSDIPPTTPNFLANQTYIQSNPGVNMQYAWDLGLNAQGIRLRDVEYGFNKSHEEFVDINANLAPGMNVSTDATQSYTEHGTGVFGILYAHNGTYGVTGLAFGAQELLLFPEWQQDNYDRINAVTQSIVNSTAGDVIVYEMQEYGPNNNYVPAEYDQVVWDLTKAATDSGIAIVAAAGNGNVDMDSPAMASYMARGNSGAIIVGAGTANTNHTRINYSCYGTRVDLQAWGENVQSTGKIASLNPILIGNDFNQSYQTFAGTSSATPIVASCAAVLQSYRHTLAGDYLSCPDLRRIMRESGIAQGTSVSGSIGPIPNMQAAVQQVYDEFQLGLNNTNALYFHVFPNPVSNQLTIMTNDFVSDKSVVEIVNSLGQVVLTTHLSAAKTVDISQLSSGFYFVKISENNLSYTQKIIKN